METNWLYLVLFVLGFIVLITILQMFSNRVANRHPQNPTFSQEATKTGIDVGKDVAKSTLIWTLSSMLSSFFRSMIQGKKH